MKLILEIFGEGKDLTTFQMCCRAIIVFIIALALIRISGRRSFGLHTTYDNIMAILLGSILSRPVVGASPFLPTIAACLVIAILHRIFGILGVRLPWFGRLTKGAKIPLYKDGKFIEKNLIRSLVSVDDIMEGVRIQAMENSLENIKTVYMERSGKISVVKKD